MLKTIKAKIRNTSPMEKCLGLVFVISFISIIISMFTFGLTFIHSDNAVEISAIRAIVKHKDIFPEQWIYGNGDINLMRIQIFLMLPYFLIGNLPVARMIGTLLIIIFASIAIINMCKRIFKDNSWLLAIPLFSVVVSGVNARDVIIYSGMYTSTILWITLLLTLFFEIRQESANIKKKVAFCIIEALVLSGGLRWAAEITLPFLLLVFIDGLAKYNDKSVATFFKNIYKNLLYILIPSVIGFGFFKVLGRKLTFFVSQSNDLVLPDTLEKLGKNFLTVFKNFYLCFGYFGGSSIASIKGLATLVVFVACTLICFILPISQLIAIKRENESVRFFLIYAYLHNVILLVIAIFTTKLNDYHIITVIFVDVLISARYVYAYFLNKKTMISAGIAASFVLGVIVCVCSMLEDSIGWHKMYQRQREFANTIAEKGLEKGYGSFWNAYANEVYSDGKLRLGAIVVDEYNIATYECLVDKTVYEDDDCKTFLILDENENQEYGLIEYYFEKPIDDWFEEDVPVFNQRTKKMENHRLHVLVYDYDICTRFNNGVFDGVVKPTEMVFNSEGEKTWEYILMDNGGLVHGPYTPIYKGKYTVTIQGTNVDKLDIDFSTGFEDALSYKVIDKTDNGVVVSLDVKKSVDDFDVVLENNTNDEIILKNMLFVKN